MTATSINSTTIISANSKATGALNYNESTNKKSGTLSLSYGSANITFNTVTDYMIFVNEVVIPMTNKLYSASLGGPNFIAMLPGSVGTDAITD